MALLNTLLAILFFPGTLILKLFGITVEQDEGIMRSFINSVFWGWVNFRNWPEFFYLTIQAHLRDKTLDSGN